MYELMDYSNDKERNRYSFQGKTYILIGKGW